MAKMELNTENPKAHAENKDENKTHIIDQVRKCSLNNTSLNWKDNGITANVLIETKLIKAIIDTGATRNFAEYEFIERFKQKPEFIKQYIEVFLADGSKKVVKKSIELNITLGQRTSKCTFLIMPDFKENIILGLDFLRSFDAIIMCAGLILKWNPDSKVSRTKQRMKANDAGTDINEIKRSFLQGNSDQAANLKSKRKRIDYISRSQITVESTLTVKKQGGDHKVPYAIRSLIHEILKKLRSNQRIRTMRTVNEQRYSISINRTGVVTVINRERVIYRSE